MREGWKLKELKEVCRYDKTKHNGKELPYVGLEHIESNTGKYLGDYKPLSVKSSTFHFDTSHVLYGRLRPYLNKVVVPEFEGHCSTEIFPIKLSDSLARKYLFYWLIMDSTVAKINATWTGARMPRANMNDVISFKIPIPPLTEQKQTVAILDKAFAAIDQAKANIERNIANAKELFQSKLNEIFSQRALSGAEGKGEGWEENKLGEITTKIGSGSTPRGGQASYKESGISLIRSMNVHDDGFREKNLAFIDEEQASKLNNVTIEENDVLLNITGASVARCCIVDNNYLPARVNQHVSIIRLKNGILNPEFLHYALTSKQTKDKLLGIGEQGSTRQAITKSQIENFSIKFPTEIKQQTSLVNALNEIRNNSEKLVNSYKLKILLLEELKKSILQKAFAGELTSIGPASSERAGSATTEKEVTV